MTLLVQSPGMFTTVQDLGRPGYGHLGVSASGAADPLSLRIGNRLVGNPDGAAALEITMLGGTFVFPDGATVALAGGDFGASVPPWTTVTIPPGETVRLGPSRRGARAYLCVRGGIRVPLWLGSASTHILTGLGGYQGRALKKGDVLAIGDPPAAVSRRSLHLDSVSFTRTRFRVTPGPQWEHFPESAREAFLSANFRISEQSNRMGIRLTGAPIETVFNGQMTTEGVSLGAIQIPSGGQPIILFVEQQTTGGYPKIANVIAADLPNLGQLRPRDEVTFELVDFPTAVRLLREQEETLRREDLFN